MKVWNVAIYARVSTDKKEQQESIPVQVESLKKWISEKSKADTSSVYNLVEVYEDQGFSGSNFNRASFIRMKEDIEAGKINMIVTKDLSRFSRNYITAGYYIEDYFKINNIRFISILDNVDTLEEVNDIVPFKNILNEMYIKDCSRKVKDALKQRMQRGSSIASRPPYGYKFETFYEGNLKTIKLVPANDDTTEIVREIYKLFISGWGYGRIATYLNSKKILPPSKRTEIYSNSKFGIWNNGTIKSILTNPKYGGMLVQQRFKKLSYKVKVIKPTNSDEWIFGGEFKGIIHREVFEEVQRMIKLRGQNYRYHDDNIHPYSTVLKCNECGGSMSYRKNYSGYKCTNSQKGGNRCTAHSVKESLLNSLIARDIDKFAEEFIDIDKIAKDLADQKVNNMNKQKELSNIIKELSKLDRQIEMLYEDKLNHQINNRNFENIVKTIEIKQETLLRRRDELEKLNKDTGKKDRIYELNKDSIEMLIQLKSFGREAIEKFIDKIVVCEDKEKGVKRIDIYYKFKDSINHVTNNV